MSHSTRDNIVPQYKRQSCPELLARASTYPLHSPYPHYPNIRVVTSHPPPTGCLSSHLLPQGKFWLLLARLGDQNWPPSGVWRGTG